MSHRVLSRSRFLPLCLILGALILSPLAWGNPSATTDSTTTLYPPLDMGANAEQIPAGLRLKIAFITPLDSRTANLGDEFEAKVAQDLWANKQLILPKGTVIRGRVEEVKRPGFFSHGGELRLTFDHVLMPSGDLLPLSMDIDAASTKMDPQKNALYVDPGIGNKLNSSVDSGIAEYKRVHDSTVKPGQTGLEKFFTVPAGAIAGVATGTAVTTFDAAKAVFGKGESVTIVSGDQLTIDFSKAAILPAQ